MKEISGIMNAAPVFECVSLKGCEPTCDCLQQNGIDQCTMAPKTVCTEQADGLHITCQGI